jgi:hypothetical protein
MDDYNLTSDDGLSINLESAGDDEELARSAETVTG